MRSGEDVAAAVRDLTRGAGVEAVFELVGASTTMAQALAALGKVGALVLIGYSFAHLELSPLDLVVPEAKILTSVGNAYGQLVEALHLAGNGLLWSVVHETAPLDDVARVLEDLRERPRDRPRLARPPSTLWSHGAFRRPSVYSPRRKAMVRGSRCESGAVAPL